MPLLIYILDSLPFSRLDVLYRLVLPTILSTTMLLQSWLLTTLVPLALGAPVFRESSPPTLTIMDSIANATSPEKLAESRHKIALGSKSRLQGSASSDEYPSLGHGVRHKGKTALEGEENGNGSSLNGTAGDTSQEPTKMGLNRANKEVTYRKGIADNVGSNNTLSNATLSDGGSLMPSGSESQDIGVSGIGAVAGTAGTSGEAPGGKLHGTPSHGSGGKTASKNVAIGSADETGSGETSTGQQGTTPSTGTTSASGSIISGTNTPQPQ